MRVRSVLGAAGVSLSLVLTPVVADAATKTAAPKKPVGGVKLTTKTLKKRSGVSCGRIAGVWLPGSTLKGGWFVTYQQQTVTKQKDAKKAKGAKKRKALRKEAAALERKARTQYPRCAPLNAAAVTQRPGGGVPTSPGAGVPGQSPGYYVPPQQAPVRVDVRDGIALALRAQPTQYQPTGSNLAVVGRSGDLRDAVVSGAATVSRFLVAPDGSTYVLFSYPVALDVNDPNSTCLLARVVDDSTVPACVDRTLTSIYWEENYGRNQAIQFDASGAIYYTGSTNTGSTVLRRFANGQSKDLITDNAYISDFLVLPDGSVIISGQTQSTQASWLRRVTTDGSLQSLRAAQSSFLRRFPDGNVYLGMSDQRFQGVLRFSTKENAIEPTAWIADSYGGYGGAVAENDLSPICTGDGWTRFEGLCSTRGATIQRTFTTTDDQVYVLAGYGPRMLLTRYYPTLQIPDVAINRVTVGATNGRDIVVAGLNAKDENVLGAFDAVDGKERVLIDVEREIEIYHLDFTPDGRTVLFDGLRFSDNSYVVGQVDLATGDITAATPTGSKLQALQAIR